MRRTAAAIRSVILSIASSVGLEGAFLLAGTVLLAVAASYVSPIGPLVIIGSMCILAGLALAIPTRSQ